MWREWPSVLAVEAMSAPAAARWMGRWPRRCARFWNCCAAVLPYNNLRTIEPAYNQSHGNCTGKTACVFCGGIADSGGLWRTPDGLDESPRGCVQRFECHRFGHSRLHRAASFSDRLRGAGNGVDADQRVRAGAAEEDC